MYAISLGQGKIFKIIPTGEADTTGTIPPIVTVLPVTDDENGGGSAEELSLSEQDDADENDESDED